MMGDKDTSALYYGRKEPIAGERGGRLPTALALPGRKGLAVSTLGWQVVYRLLAGEPELALERFFTSAPGKASLSEESGSPLDSFPVIAMSVTFEEDFLHLLRALQASGIPPRTSDRTDYPLVLAGGPIAFLNPAPIAPFVDLFWVGEADRRMSALLLDLKTHVFNGGSKADFLEEVKDRPGVWVPGKSRLPVSRVLPENLKTDLSDPAFSCFISNEAAFKDTLLLEVNRGCPYGCRFCAAGYIYRPPRQARMDDLKAIVEHTDPPKVGLVGTALTDWPDLLEFIRWLHKGNRKFSLSSIRADGITEELMGFLRTCGVRTITLSLEAPSERLRLAASKNLEQEDFIRAVEICARHGVNHLKVYMIIGWPGETDADYDELENFMAEILAARERAQGKGKKNFMRITLSASCLVPKPWTPFQWAPMASEKHLNDVLKRLKAMIKPLRGVALSADNPFQARLQGLLARGDEKIADFLLLAAEKGGWKKALKLWDGNPEEYLDRERGEEESFPWEVIDLGVRRGYLLKEWQKSKESKSSPGCPDEACQVCGRCGIRDWLEKNLEE